MIETVRTPHIVHKTPTLLPKKVVGEKSPKPTEVIVTITSQIELAYY